MWWLAILVLVILLVFWFIKKTGNIKTFVRTLLGPLVIAYKLEKENYPNATEEELSWEIIRIRMANPLGCRGLTKDEMQIYLDESKNIADTMLSIIIRDLIKMDRYDSVNDAVKEGILFLSETGLEREVLESKLYKGYFEDK